MEECQCTLHGDGMVFMNAEIKCGYPHIYNFSTTINPTNEGLEHCLNESGFMSDLGNCSDLYGKILDDMECMNRVFKGLYLPDNTTNHGTVCNCVEPCEYFDFKMEYRYKHFADL